jgi:hypothetical protein
MNPKLATHWPWSAPFCAALSGCGSPPPAPSTTPATVVPTTQHCPLEGMPFMVSETGTKPEADLCVDPNQKTPFRTSLSYGTLDLTSWLANKDVDALSFGLDWVATQDPAYWRMIDYVAGSSNPGWEGWGAILYGDHRMIHAYAWGDPTKLGAVNLAVGHQTLHDMTSYGIERIDAIDFNAWVFSGPPSSVCYAPHPPPAGQEYDPTLVYSIPGPPAGTTADVNNSGATLWGVKAVQENGVWAWHGPFVVAPPGDLGLQLGDDIGHARPRPQARSLDVLPHDDEPQGDARQREAQRRGVHADDVGRGQELETSGGIKFVASVPLTSKPSTACAIDPSKFNWRGLRGGLPKEAQAVRE